MAVCFGGFVLQFEFKGYSFIQEWFSVTSFLPRAQLSTRVGERGKNRL